VPSRYDNLLNQLNTLKALYKREQFKNECLGIKRRLATSLKLFKEMKHSIVCENAVFHAINKSTETIIKTQE
jgi:hypothetical protein